MSESENVENTEVDLKTEELKTKKQNSYTYWVNNDPNFFGGKKPENLGPSKVEQEVAQKIKQEEESKKDGHSAWNSSGTWEERALKNNLIKENLEANLPGTKTKDGKIEISGVGKIEGEGNIVLVRGKKKLGYDLKIKIHYKGLDELEGAEGSIKFTDFMDDGDYEYEVSVKEGSSNGDGAKKLVTQNIKEFVALVTASLRKFVE